MKPLAVISGGMLLMSLSLTIQAEPITANNWFNHPDIVTIRGIFNSIQNAKQAGQLNKKVGFLNTVNLTLTVSAIYIATHKA